MTRTPRSVALAMLAAVVLVACGQPREPLNVGMREVPNDIVLGGGATPTPEPTNAPPPPPLPPTPVVISAPVAIAPPARPRFTPPPRPQASASPSASPAATPSPSVSASPSGTPSPTPTAAPADVCPADNPLDAPAKEARRDFAIPPAEEVLTYRNLGSFSISGADANEGTFEGDTMREVTEVEPNEDDDDFTYAVVARLADTVTTSTYRAINTPPIPELGVALDQAGAQDTRGLYLVSTVTEAPDGTMSSFAPQPELLLLPFPSSLGDTFDAAGADPISGVSMSYSATIGDTVRVNACGAPVQGVEVVLSAGRIVGPDQNVDFTARYVFATQYGGMSMEDEFNIAGTEAGQTSSRTNLATINLVPTFGPDAPAPDESASASPSPSESAS